MPALPLYSNSPVAVAGFAVDRGESWKESVFSGSAKLERGDVVAGFGDFNVSEQAAGQVRLKLAEVTVQSLPLPVYPETAWF